jgi:hypothetical protein
MGVGGNAYASRIWKEGALIPVFLKAPLSGVFFYLDEPQEKKTE